MSHDNNWFHRMRRGEVPRAAVSELLQEAFETVDVQSGQLRMQVTAAPTFCNPAGGVQGGMISAMLDTATAGVVDATLLPDQVPVTLSLNVQFLSGARPGVLNAEAHITKRGRDTCFVQGDLYQGKSHVATAQAVLKILTLKKPS